MTLKELKTALELYPRDMEVLMTIFCQDINAACAQDITAVGITHHPDTRKQCLALIGQKARPFPGMTIPRKAVATPTPPRNAVVLAPICATTTPKTDDHDNS